VDSPNADPDPASVLAALGWDAATLPVRISGGWDTLLWKFDTADGASHALRLYRAYAEPGHLAVVGRNEALAMRAAHAAGLPVPALEAEGAFEDRPAFVIEWAQGEPFANLAARQPFRVVALGRAMGRLQARLHAVPPPAGLFQHDAARVEHAVDHAGLREAILAAARFDAFCHLDFHPLNVLGTGTEPTALIDWTNAAISDRRIDLAYTHATLTVATPPPGPPRLLVAAARRLLARGWRKGYMEAAGSFPLDPLFEAVGTWRYVTEAERAFSEGRGWLSTAEVARLRRARDQKLRAAGLTPEA
jgi:aminoglycoside phosphotransferase (APT) family kinase protein